MGTGGKKEKERRQKGKRQKVTVVVAVAVAAAVPKAILRRGGLHKMLSSELAELVPQSGDARHCR